MQIEEVHHSDASRHGRPNLEYLSHDGYETMYATIKEHVVDFPYGGDFVSCAVDTGAETMLSTMLRDKLNVA